MIIKDLRLWLHSFIIHVFALRTKISEPADFVVIFEIRTWKVCSRFVRKRVYFNISWSYVGSDCVLRGFFRGPFGLVLRWWTEIGCKVRSVGVILHKKFSVRRVPYLLDKLAEETHMSCPKRALCHYFYRFSLVAICWVFIFLQSKVKLMHSSTQIKHNKP